MKIEVTQRSKAQKIKVYNFNKKYTDSQDRKVEMFWSRIIQDLEGIK